MPAQTYIPPRAILPVLLKGPSKSPPPKTIPPRGRKTIATRTCTLQKLTPMVVTMTTKRTTTRTTSAQRRPPRSQRKRCTNKIRKISTIATQGPLIRATWKRAWHQTSICFDRQPIHAPLSTRQSRIRATQSTIPLATTRIGQSHPIRTLSPGQSRILKMRAL